MRKPEVGETLYSLNVGNAARRTPQVLTPVVVTKVGRKYFTVGEGYAARQFHISDWTEKTEYSAVVALYESEQELEDEKESARLRKELGKAFEYGQNRNELTLDTLRQMHGLLTANAPADRMERQATFSQADGCEGGRS